MLNFSWRIFCGVLLRCLQCQQSLWPPSGGLLLDDIVNFVNRILCSHFNLTAWTLLIKERALGHAWIHSTNIWWYLSKVHGPYKRQATSLWIPDTFFDKKKTNHWLILLFYHGLKKIQTCSPLTIVKTKLFNKSIRNFYRRLSKDGAKRQYKDFDSVMPPVVQHMYLSYCPRKNQKFSSSVSLSKFLSLHCLCFVHEHEYT